MTSRELVELERRVDPALKGMNILLFGEAESISRKEKTELQNRLSDYLAGKRSEFVKLKDLQGSTTQESR